MSSNNSDTFLRTPVMQWCEINLVTFFSFSPAQKEMWVKEADDTLKMLREVKWPLEHLLVSFFHSFSSLIFITSLQLCPHRRPTAQTAPNPLTNPHFNITSFTKAKSRQKSTSPSSAAFNMQDAAIEATERRYYELDHLWERFFNDSVVSMLFLCFLHYVNNFFTSRQQICPHYCTRANREVLT